MKSKLLIPSVIIFLLLINGYYFYDRYQLKNRVNAQIKQIEETNANHLDVNHQLRRIEFSNEDLPLKKDCQILSVDNQAFLLKSLLTSGKKLVFCVPEGVCNVCYDSLFSQFSKMSERIGKDNILVLVPKERLREAINEFQVRNISVNLYGAGATQLGTVIGKGYVPFLFILDRNMRLDNLFIPDKFDSEMTDIYFKMMESRFKKV